MASWTRQGIGTLVRGLVVGGLALAATVLGGARAAGQEASAPETTAPRPNVLLCIADDWSWPHAGAYGDVVVRTPAFDRVAAEGVLFHQAYVASPSCTPSRAALLTGQWHWRLEGAANLYGSMPDRFETYPELLARAGYAVGSTRRGYGPGSPETPDRPVAGPVHATFRDFLAARPKDRPFCFWLGSIHPHRPYPFHIGQRGGVPLDALRVPPYLSDGRPVRADLADYVWQLQVFDAEVRDALAALEEQGLLDETLVVVTSDNGMPFPRCKSNLYDSGTRVPLAVRWGGHLAAGRTVDDFVSLTDLAPTFLELAGAPVPEAMTGKSLVRVLESTGSGRIDPARDHVLTGKERHVPGQEAPNLGGYPMRAIRTHEWLYIRNYEPDRWPTGTPDHEHAVMPDSWYADIDGSPTKTYMVARRDEDEAHRRAFALSFEKRPPEELYDVRADPDEVINLAADPAHAETRAALAARLQAELVATEDPRATGHGGIFDLYPYTGAAPAYPGLLELDPSELPVRGKKGSESPGKDAPPPGDAPDDPPRDSDDSAARAAAPDRFRAPLARTPVDSAPADPTLARPRRGVEQSGSSSGS